MAKMNNHCCRSSSKSSIRRRDRPIEIARVAVVTMSLVLFAFPKSILTSVESFTVKYESVDLYCRGYCMIPSFLAQSSSPSKLSSLPFSSNDSESHSTTSMKSPAANTSISDTSATNFEFNISTSLRNGSKEKERKRYDAELKEAFARQTRERNPLLGIKSIGVDYGLVRTGVAVTIGYSPEVLDVIVTDHPLLQEDELEGMSEEEAEKEEERRLEIQREKVTERVIELALSEKADRIVVGLPLHKNGTEAPQTALTRKFALDHLAIATLRTLGPEVSVYMCDERYTSKEAAARMRGSQSSYRREDNLYGLLDGESAKIILEQYYNDHVDRSNFNTKNCGDNQNGSESNTTKLDFGFNSELVKIADADIVEALTIEYNEKRRLEKLRLSEERKNREARANWRKQAIEEDRKRQKEQQQENAANGNATSKKKKKKKKKRK